MNKQGFTLLEMLVVMFIITILLLLTIPNITGHKNKVEQTGCESYADVVQTQVSAYELIEGRLPNSISQLKNKGYITQTTCSNGKRLILSGSEVLVE